MTRYTQNAKQVLRDGKHFADCIDDGAAKMIAEALNERRGMPQTQKDLPLDDNGPLFTGVGGLVCPSCNRQRQPYRECPHCLDTHQVRQENDEYACSCGARWDVTDGEDHP